MGIRVWEFMVGEEGDDDVDPPGESWGWYDDESSGETGGRDRWCGRMVFILAALKEQQQQQQQDYHQQ